MKSSKLFCFCQNLPSDLEIFPKNSSIFFENSRILRKLKQKTQFSAFPKPVNVRQVAQKEAELCILKIDTNIMGFGPLKLGRFDKIFLDLGIWLQAKPVVSIGFYIARNSFTRFRAGLKVNLRQYIKSDFDLFWVPDVLWRSDSDTESQS